MVASEVRDIVREELDELETLVQERTILVRQLIASLGAADEYLFEAGPRLHLAERHEALWAECDETLCASIREQMEKDHPAHDFLVAGLGETVLV